jgi:hypothetical protein
MGSLAAVLDILFALGKVAALGFLAYGAWLALRFGPGFTGEGEGRFEHRHRRRAREVQRLPAEEERLA